MHRHARLQRHVGAAPPDVPDGLPNPGCHPSRRRRSDPRPCRTGAAVWVEELPRFASSVDEIVEDKKDQNHRYARVLREARRAAEAEGVKLAARVVAGHAVPTIVELIEREGFDLLVIGFMGHSALYNRLIGSTTDRLVELAPCPVLVAK